MTTNKPEVVAYRYTASRSVGKRNRKWHYQESFPHAGNREVAEIGQMEELIRLRDYEALQAECEKLRCIISDIKDWDCDVSGGFLSIPVGLRRRIQDALAAYRK